jgi:hypothetical protein
MLQVAGALGSELAVLTGLATSFSIGILDLFWMHRWQVVFSGHDGFASLVFEFQAGTFGNLAPVLAADLFSVSPVAAVVSAIWRVESSARAVKMNSASLMWSRRFWVSSPFNSFQFLVGFHADPAPFLMDEIGEDGVFLAIPSQQLALPHHPPIETV